MKSMFLYFYLVSLVTGSVSPQAWDVGSDSVTTSPPDLRGSLEIPPDWQSWTPDPEFVSLYVNYDNRDSQAVPHIDIMGYLGSWPYTMGFVQDTLYMVVAPPGYTAIGGRVDSLPNEFPLLILAGTERAVYWASIDDSLIRLDPIQTAPFLSVTLIHPVAHDVIAIQFESSGPRSFKPLKEMLTCLGDNVEVVQMNEGFYQGIWHHVRQVTIQRYRVNETQLGTLVFIRVRDDSAIDTVRQQLADACR